MNDIVITLPQSAGGGEVTPPSLVHFSGIGGSAMNGLAGVLVDAGFSVTGTDPAIDPRVANRLTARGIEVQTIQDGSTILQQTALVVASAALSADHPELVRATEKGVPVIKYAQLLGSLFNQRRGVAVAGTHGKTTTSAMTVAALRGAGLDPGFVIGGTVLELNDCASCGSDATMVAEACEYDRSFLNLDPEVAIVTNVEADHLDVYSGLPEIIETFAAFVEGGKDGGRWLYCVDDPGACQVAAKVSGGIGYGFGGGAFYRATAINKSDAGCTFVVMGGHHELSRVTLPLTGEHNILNATAAFAAGHLLGADPAGLARGLTGFGGVARRMELLGEQNGITVLDDYAHHPTEIKALVSALRQRFEKRRLVVAFQPHQVSRTAHLFDAFVAALKGVDQILLPEIYAAREKEGNAPKVTSAQLGEALRKLGCAAHYTGDLVETARYGASLIQSGDVFVTVGAGDVYKVGRLLMAQLKSETESL